MQNILFFGDSLTAGYGLRNASSESFPGLIAAKIKAEGLPYNVINAGLSGDTSGGGLNRINYWLNQPVSVFVLELGINDIIRSIPPPKILANLQQLVDIVKTKYPQVKLALMGMQIPAFIPSPFTQQFNAIYPSLARVNNMAFVPFFLEGVAGKAQFNLPDRLHPSAQGYKVIAENVWPVIKPLLT